MSAIGNHGDCFEVRGVRERERAADSHASCYSHSSESCLVGSVATRAASRPPRPVLTAPITVNIEYTARHDLRADMPVFLLDLKRFVGVQSTSIKKPVVSAFIALTWLATWLTIDSTGNSIFLLRRQP